MDGLKPANRVSRAGTVRSSPGTVSPIAHTELPPARTVTAPSDGAPQRGYNPPRDGHPQSQTPHEYLVDPEAREVIYRAADAAPATGNSLDAALKLRAYRSPPSEPGDAPANGALEKTA